MKTVHNFKSKPKKMDYVPYIWVLRIFQIEVKRSSEVISGEKVVSINFSKNAFTYIVKPIDYLVL